MSKLKINCIDLQSVIVLCKIVIYKLNKFKLINLSDNNCKLRFGSILTFLLKIIPKLFAKNNMQLNILKPITNFTLKYIFINLDIENKIQSTPLAPSNSKSVTLSQIFTTPVNIKEI